MPAISVIVPARDASATIGATLTALAAQRLDVAYEVIVVDNGSTDETGRLARAAGATVIRRARGEGPGAARNAGARVSGADLLAFTDADCRPEADWLAAGLEGLHRADLVQGAVAPDRDACAGPFDRTLWVGAPSGLFEAASLFVRRSVFEAVGGFPAGLERDGDGPFGEDTLFGWEARRSGAEVAFADRAVVRHAVAPRRAIDYVAERRRLELFPELVARVPELRETLCYGRVFLSARTAALDAALVGLAAAVVRRRPLLGLAASVPYAAISLREAAGWGPRIGVRVAAAGLAADAVGLAGLAAGSLRSGSPVL